MKVVFTFKEKTLSSVSLVIDMFSICEYRSLNNRILWKLLCYKRESKLSYMADPRGPTKTRIQAHCNPTMLLYPGAYNKRNQHDFKINYDHGRILYIGQVGQEFEKPPSLFCQRVVQWHMKWMTVPSPSLDSQCSTGMLSLSACLPKRQWTVIVAISD